MSCSVSLLTELGGQGCFGMGGTGHGVRIIVTQLCIARKLVLLVSLIKTTRLFEIIAMLSYDSYIKNPTFTFSLVCSTKELYGLLIKP
jgi:hypothetical protein